MLQHLADCPGDYFVVFNDEDTGLLHKHSDSYARLCLTTLMPDDILDLHGRFGSYERGALGAQSRLTESMYDPCAPHRALGRILPTYNHSGLRAAVL
ncbi:MAG: hypothetical protein ABW250_20120, partial [Pyrinomonadaceae bacterium]